jgi:hypothetical protein
MSVLLANGTCRSCDAPVTWVITPTGARMPLDPTPAPDGNVWIAALAPSGDMVIGVSLNNDGVPPDKTSYVSHYVSCPQADEWRTNRKRITQRKDQP